MSEKKGFGETFLYIFEKLAGKQSDLELIFGDLTLEVAGLKMKLNGTVALNVKYYVEAKQQ